jgi:hypothetical protein
MHKHALSIEASLAVGEVEAILAPEAVTVAQRQHFFTLGLPSLPPRPQRDGIVGPNVLAAMHCRTRREVRMEKR